LVFGIPWAALGVGFAIARCGVAGLASQLPGKHRASPAWAHWQT